MLPQAPAMARVSRMPRVRYERFMASAIPGSLAVVSLYLVLAGWEHVVAPWLGRTSWVARGITAWSLLLLFLAWISYYNARTTDPGSMPRELGEQIRSMPPQFRNAQNYCDKCENVKPPRAHHCRRCKRCTMRMDHHCVGLNNCVGLYNWKYFLSMWVYMFLASVNGLIVMAARFYFRSTFNPDTYEKAHCVGFTLLCTFTAWTGYKHGSMHLNLALLNLTSIEYMSLPAFISLNFCQRYGIAWSRISNYDKGWRHNLIMILGEPAITWFMPWVTPRSPWGPNPVTWYSGFNIRDLYDPPAATRTSGPQVNAHNHDLGPRNNWNMYDEPVQHAADGLRQSNLKGKGSMPLLGYQEGVNGAMHHGDSSHNHGHGGAGGHNHASHNHSHGSGGGGEDDMPGLLSDEELSELGAHNHSHSGGAHSHAH